MEFWRLNSNGMKHQASKKLKEQNTVLTLILQLLNLTGKFTEQLLPSNAIGCGISLVDFSC